MSADRDEIGRQLSQQLGPEYISQRPGGSGTQYYVEGAKIINLANDIFGFDGWSSEVRSTGIDYDRQEKDGRISLGIHCIMRITLKNGNYHEDVGYGSVDNVRSRSMAMDKCRKEATTDAMKRAFRQFGNALGNCIYDKSYTNAVRTVNYTKSEFDPNELRRPIKGPPTKRVALSTNGAPAPAPAPVRGSAAAPAAAAPAAAAPSIGLPAQPALAARANGQPAQAAPAQAAPARNGAPVTPRQKQAMLPDSDDDFEFDLNRRTAPAVPLPEVREAAEANPAAQHNEQPAGAGEQPNQTGQPEQADVSMSAIFVSAGNAKAYQENPSKLTEHERFDLSYQSPGIKSTLPQDRSSKVIRPANT